MLNGKKETTGFLTCSYCGNYAPMDIVVNYYLSTKPTYDDPEDEYYYRHEPEHGYRFKLLLCKACGEITIWKYFEADFIDDDQIKIETIYPTDKSKLLGLPYSIQKAYEISLKVRVIDVNAYAVLLGRILEMVCDDRKAIGKNLYEKLEDLAAKREIPEKLVGVAHNLRQLRNVGAHASFGELTHDEIPILDDLCRAILEYVYSAIYLAKKAERRVEQLKEKQKSKN